MSSFRKETIKEIKKSSIGLLINTNYNLHSLKYTSPLKYFEYLFGGLKIIAVNFPAHHELPFSDNISFFDFEDKSTFVQALNRAENKKVFKINDLHEITLDSRIKKILDFIKYSTPGGIRTPNPLIRSQMLYPVKLQAQKIYSYL